MKIEIDPVELARLGIDSADLTKLLARSRSLFEGSSWRLVAVGKGSSQMVEAVARHAEVVDGVVVTPKKTKKPSVRSVRVIEADHPVPGRGSFRAGEAVLDYVNSLSRGERVLFLVSGGASSLMESPLVPEEELVDLWLELLRSGLDIWEVNAVRKHVSRVKGGRLGYLAYKKGLEFKTLIASDVPCDDPSVVGSGPTVPDPTTFKDVELILRTRGLWGKLPSGVKKLLEKGLSGEADETPKDFPSDNHVVASNADVLRSIRSRLGGRIVTSCLGGEAREIGKLIANMLREEEGPLILGGEPTVTVRGGGRGGRTSELALSFAYEAYKYKGMALVAVATDGIDGNTGAAGVWSDDQTWARAVEKGLDPLKAFEDNDTYSVFEGLGQSIVTGPTGTNLNIFVFAFRGRFRQTR